MPLQESNVTKIDKMFTSRKQDTTWGQYQRKTQIQIIYCPQKLKALNIFYRTGGGGGGGGERERERERGELIKQRN